MSNKYWMGSEDTYEAALAAIVKCENYRAQNPKAMFGDGEDDNSDDNIDDRDKSPFLTVADGVGIITITGSLVDGEYGMLGIWFGITGYSDIQKALVAAVRDADVKSIMLVIKSGGGSVSGVSETAKFIESVDKVKPITTYSPSTMASAALWLGLAGREVFLSNTAIAGSIGTLTVVASRQRQLQEMGIDAEVIRSGKYKALGHDVDPLSDIAREDAQRTIDYLADIFLTYVSSRRGVSKLAADTKFGQGRTFIGEQAVAVGLVDKVSTYTQAFLASKAKATTDNSSRIIGGTIDVQGNTEHNANQTEGNEMHIPTTEELAAMAAGIDLKASDDKVAAVVPPAVVPEASAEVSAQLAEANTAIETLNAKVSELTAEAETFKATASTLQATLDEQAGLADIVRATIKTMSLPFNLETGSLAELTGTNLVAKHKEISELFKSKVKAGSVSVPAAQAKAPASALTPVFVEQAMSLPGAN